MRYHPITGTPFQQDETYREYPPCNALRPYIRCFWGTEKPVALPPGQDEPGIVIPDTCMDIIFDVNHTRGSLNGFFAAIDEGSYRTGGWRSTDTTSTFGIRFYAWTAALFTGESFAGKKNGHYPVEMFFAGLKNRLEPLLWEMTDMSGRIRMTETILLSLLDEHRFDADVMNAVDCLLTTNGRARIAELSGYTAASQKKLERAFSRQVGLSPKAFAGLVRYQLLWQDAVRRGGIDAPEMVEKYGYTDQAHLLNDFRHRHLMNPTEALELAGRKR